MTIQTLKEQMPDFANDTKLNLSSVLKDASGLSVKQIAGIALASAYTLGNAELIEALQDEFEAEVDEAMLKAAKAAASIMAMNNIYYRFVHLVSDKDYMTMPAKLRMNIVANPGIDNIDFELYAVAVSALNGCGLCMDSHVKKIEKAGVSKQAIQHVVRIAADNDVDMVDAPAPEEPEVAADAVMEDVAEPEQATKRSHEPAAEVSEQRAAKRQRTDPGVTKKTIYGNC